MTSNRIAFVSAIGLAVLALFMMGGAEAVNPLDNPTIIPSEERVDSNTVMNFAIDFDSDGDTVTNLAIDVWFDGIADPIALTCSSGCESGSPDGTYSIVGEGPQADTLVAYPRKFSGLPALNRTLSTSYQEPSSAY